MERITLIGRNSRLSILQIEQVKRKIRRAFPALEINIITRSSRGDQLQHIPLQTVEGSDFFTRDIFDALKTGEADIAVHSLKDMSAEHFFGDHFFAVTGRDDAHDIALFNPQIVQKLKQGEKIIIGTCSPRREVMAIDFLQKALPQLNSRFQVESKVIRGNVDTRLRKLHQGEYDGIIIAAAGLNRLLMSQKDAAAILELMNGKKKMLLPLIECVPAPCQGAIVAEAHRANKNAVEVLRKINRPELMETCVQEKKTAMQYGTGCLQRFGVTSIAYEGRQALYAAGTHASGESFSEWWGLPKLASKGRKFFSSTDYMGHFFEHSNIASNMNWKEPVLFVSNYKALPDMPAVRPWGSKTIWAAGTKTWFELAQKGLWVEGCADALGLESLEATWSMPLFNINKEQVRIITHEDAARHWQAKGWKTAATYALHAKPATHISVQLQQADIIFWTSYRQFEQYHSIIKDTVLHCCPSGETASLLKEAGLAPVIFPNIKAFQQWRKSITPIRSVA